MMFYAKYAGKDRTNSNLAWHRPQSATSRVEQELIKKSLLELESATDPLEKLRLLCLSHGAGGIMALCRIFRRTDSDEGHETKHLNREEFLNIIKKTGLDISTEDAEALFNQFDTDGSDTLSIDEFIDKIRPPMSEGRRSIVKQAFHKLDKTGQGIVPIEDLRRIYSVTASPGYMCGEETSELTMLNFLAHFETEGTFEGNVTLEEFMNYYSGISVSIDNDCYFDLMMRQAFKL